MWLRPSGSCLRPCIWSISRPPDILLQGIRQTYRLWFVRLMSQQTDPVCFDCVWNASQKFKAILISEFYFVIWVTLCNIFTHIVYMDGLFEIYSWWLWEFHWIWLLSKVGTLKVYSCLYRREHQPSPQKNSTRLQYPSRAEYSLHIIFNDGHKQAEFCSQQLL